jgi:hypothetical protein
MKLTCPTCWIEYPDDQAYIAHRFKELADWFNNCGELDNAERYATKDPTEFHLVDGIIERKANQ